MLANTDNTYRLLTVVIYSADAEKIKKGKLNQNKTSLSAESPLNLLIFLQIYFTILKNQIAKPKRI